MPRGRERGGHGPSAESARANGRLGGRPKGVPNKAGLAVRKAAQKYSTGALKRLWYLAEHAESETAQVSACREILDRAHGRPHQEVTGIGGEPLEVMQRVVFEVVAAKD